MKPTRRTLVLAALLCPLAGQLHADLLHHYKFDETSGIVAADSAGEADGTIGTNVTLGQAGRLGTSFRFPAVANPPHSRVTLPSSAVPGAAFTMSAFVLLADSYAGQMHIISGNNNTAGRWNLAISDEGSTAPRLFWFHNGGLGTARFDGFDFNESVGQWVHVGITRAAGGETTLYVNGVPQSVGSNTAALASTDIGIGTRPAPSVGFPQFQFNGRIDDVRFYDHTLTAEEMEALAAENDDADGDGLPDDWEIFHFIQEGEDPVADRETILARQGPDDDSDGDGFNNLIEFLANTKPNDDQDFPQGDSDFDGMDDGWEWLNFGTLARDGYGDFDGDGSLDFEEYGYEGFRQGLLIERNPDGTIASITPFTGSSDPANPDSQPDDDSDGLPDGWEYVHFGHTFESGGDDFDEDGFDNLSELLAGSNPARKTNTPANVGNTTRIAVTHAQGIEEYSVTRGTWTHVRRIATLPNAFAVTGHSDGYLYATAATAVLRVHPATGQVTTLAVRGEGAAAAAGWLASDPQGIETGPDGKLYFSTAFGNAGEGVFRLNTDGSGFEKFIARSGSSDAGDWDLNNARDLAWDGADLYVSARGGFNAAGRPVYRFDSTGALTAIVSAALIGPQGLAVEEDGLLVTSTSTGLTSLYLLDTSSSEFPVLPSDHGAAGALSGMDAIDLDGDTYYITFNTGPDNVGQIIRRLTGGVASVVVNALPASGNDFAIFASDLEGLSYDSWAAGFGIDPSGPNGAPEDDYDGDGTTNFTEFLLGLDPTDGASRFAIAIDGDAAAGLTLTWPSAEGIAFEIRSSTDLEDWSTLEATVTGQAAQTTATWTAPPASGPRKFYRIQFNP